jgi:uncharacterized membrane protein
MNDQSHVSAGLTSVLVTLCAAFDIELIEMSMASDNMLRACIQPHSYRVPLTIEAKTAGALWDAIVRLAGQIRGVYA